jgi:phosphoribosylamine---glycine ligase
MNILIIGSGAREHALAWKIKASALVDEVFCAPGNPGMDALGPCFDVKADDLPGLEKLALHIEPDLIVIGPEQPLALGLADLLRARGFDVFGPSKDAAQLEASKGFSKDRMAKYGVPTARYGRFTEAGLAKAFLDTLEAPFVLKADGLAGGKGVVIAETRAEADSEVEAMLGGKFDAASRELVIEAFMPGEEASVFVLTDGENWITLPAAQDHKRIGEGDTGPNTGGMGAYARAPVMTPELMARVEAEVTRPMIKGMAADGMPFSGVLYIGLMVTADGPKVVEFNCRFGDPECQVLMAGLAGDIVPLLLVCATGGLSAEMGALLELDSFRPSATVVMAAPGYPGSAEKGIVITGLDAANAIEGVTVFEAGTDINAGGERVSSGGRVLSVTGSADTLQEAVARAYAGVDAISFPGAQVRRDIAWRALK